MSIKIALAGNPNCGKTTLFNTLTGSNQFVGNWPGVTVEKKEGRLKNHDGVIITDLPGIYSLSPYTLEEVVARNYLINERPNVILNIIDGTNLERNLYLTMQLSELGIPTVIAINMMDVVRKNGDKINIDKLSTLLGCEIIEISALKGIGIDRLTETILKATGSNKTVPIHRFSEDTEKAVEELEKNLTDSIPTEKKRWYAVKIFERDEKILAELKLDNSKAELAEEITRNAEEKADDDSESIITNERYTYISELLQGCYKKKSAGSMTVSDKIDRVVTNRFAALPIFAVIMFLVYFISITTVGTWATDWANDGVFGDGWHLFGIGSKQYEQAAADYAEKSIWTEELILTVQTAASDGCVGADEILNAVNKKDFVAFEESYGTYADSLAQNGFSISEQVDSAMESAPDASEYGVWVPGIPTLAEQGLELLNAPEWLNSLIIDGIIGGVGAVLGFIPQMIVLFILLAFLEACGYMARIAFVMDRIFRKFGLSGKSFIPMLIGTGCGVPGIMASRTIENERDRRMTIITTTFIPCSAKLPIIALIASSLFGGAWWVAPSAYFIGAAAIVISGIILKKTRIFSGETAPFIMELPAYHMPTFSNIMRSMWERASSFIRKAGTIILLASIFIWFGSSFGFTDVKFMFSTETDLQNSILGIIGGVISKIFVPLGFGNIKAAIATVMGLVAKEEIVGVFGVLDFEGMGKLSAYSFLIFNLLCAPCFAAIGAIKREMNSFKWTLFAIGYQCLFAYAVSLIVYQIGSAIGGNMNIIGLAAAVITSVFLIYMIVRPQKKSVKE